MYEIEFLPRAAEDFNNLDSGVASRVLKKIRWLAENFESIKPEPLVREFEGLLKLGAGDYRIIYQADRENRVLRIHFVGHRREVYR